MRRFLISNADKFEGTAEIIYNNAGLLCKIDLTQCVMDGNIIEQVKRVIPFNISLFVEAKWCGVGTTVVEGDYEINFEMFWAKYNKKINKKRALAIWNKINKTEQVKSYYGIEPYDKYLKETKWRNKADPDTYLRNEMYDNEYK
ncbi:MAG: hypothetical protein JST94_11880 [Bacteroidetes bacterium]|nr:hypothetical protein [Bacteroidota bacterium]MBS1672125.1 hypothetical protein [Bacteroidota bacterium]